MTGKGSIVIFGVRRSRKLFAAAHSGCIDPCARAPTGGVRKLARSIETGGPAFGIPTPAQGDALCRWLRRRDVSCVRVQSEATDSRLRYRLVDFQIKQAQRLPCKSPPVPIPTSTLWTWWCSPRSPANRSPTTCQVVGSKAQPIIETFARLEKDAWSLVDFLTPAQQADLRRPGRLEPRCRLAGQRRIQPTGRLREPTGKPAERPQ